MKNQLFIWVRGDSFLVFLALGWKLEAVDERYWSVLLSRDPPASAASEVS